MEKWKILVHEVVHNKIWTIYLHEKLQASFLYCFVDRKQPTSPDRHLSEIRPERKAGEFSDWQEAFSNQQETKLGPTISLERTFCLQLFY